MHYLSFTKVVVIIIIYKKNGNLYAGTGDRTLVPSKGEERVDHYATLACDQKALEIKFEPNKLVNL